jgi:hypothetical protein
MAGRAMAAQAAAVQKFGFIAHSSGLMLLRKAQFY